MKLIQTSALALMFLFLSHVGMAATVVQGTENGVICDPPGISDVVRDRFVRTPADPSQPDINVLPTSPLSVGTIALSPDIPADERTEIGDPAYSACRPDPGRETPPPPLTEPFVR